MKDIRRAYNAGWASSLTQVDWDVAAERFDLRNPEPALRQAWMDGWSDRVIGHTKGHALRCGIRPNGHEGCELGS